MVKASPNCGNHHNSVLSGGKLVSFPTYIIKNLKRRFNTIDSDQASSETIVKVIGVVARLQTTLQRQVSRG
ncbi:hypothetical protein A6J66_016130 [Yersinia enterocolitica]|nr:hypothetical protein A6J66_016130 [Yersinia enterocolitica]